MIKGIPASSGITMGKALAIKKADIVIEKKTVSSVESEKNRFLDSIREAKEQVERIRINTEKKIGKEKAEIFGAHLMMLEDTELIGAVSTKIEEGVNAEYAVKETIEMFSAIFEQMENEYMRERAADVKDIGNRLINVLLGISDNSLAAIDGECIIVTKDLTPSDTAQMDTQKVLGFVTDMGGRTSHSAIMARTLEIPAVVGTKDATSNINNGDYIIVDGNEGLVIVNPDKATIEKYEATRQKELKAKQELSIYVNAESKTLDGRRVEVAANIGRLGDLEGVIRNGAEGVGLFRTEFLYMDRDNFPSEEEQFEAYKEVLERMQGKPVIIRTLDIGGDKKLTYLPIGDEMNPFLGYRAIRICLDRKDIFKTQLKALYRASIYGNLKIMFPMISNLKEIFAAKQVIAEIKEDLDRDKLEYSDSVKVGIMIEIPSAAVMSDILAKHVDFFSIGTNDLIQYTTAVDRMNEKIAHLYDPFNTSVLRLIKTVIDNGHKSGIEVGMCGEMAGDPTLVPILLGFGLDEFSMSASSMLNARKIINNMNYEKAKNAAQEVLSMETSDEIKEYANSAFQE